MRRAAIILILLGGILIAPAGNLRAAVDLGKIEILKQFARKKILYNDSISVDSVISWSEQLLPVLKQHRYKKETYFLLQLQLANAYTLRGDISLAIDRARLMYEEAKETDYKFGLVVANQAIGDAYTIANQSEKALDSYQDALNLSLIHI